MGPIKIRRVHCQPLIRRKSVWNRDEAYDSFDRPEPKRLAPAPPQQTVVNDRDRGAVEFRLIKKIGEGGQGRCDLFERKSDKKLFVYKIMKCEVETCKGKDGKTRPKEAAILLDALGPSHPRIIQLFHWVIPAPGQTAYYMEYCSGGDLYDLIKNYHKHNLKVPESFVWHVYLQLAEALAWMQENNGNGYKVVHRDIKPQNVFIRKSRYDGEYPEIVLADFGIATTRVISCEGPKDFLGTMAYQGPELPLHSRSGDTWAVGACIHEMTIGSPPISRAPPGYSVKDWYDRPEARKVSDVRKHKYSRELDTALWLTLRTDPMDRVKGNALVDGIMICMEKWIMAGGQTVMLEPWALPK